MDALAKILTQNGTVGTRKASKPHIIGEGRDDWADMEAPEATEDDAIERETPYEE